MKEATLHSLVTAKTLYENASELCISENRHVATAGLVILQDAIELVFFALLVELGVDESKSIESMTFDQLIGELRSQKVIVPKSSTLKAMNKLRVTAKHYGLLAEPITVRTFLEASKIAIDSSLQHVVNKKLHEIYLTDLLDAGESLELLKNASKHLEEKAYLKALIEIREAFYVEIEKEYSIYEWKDDVPDNKLFTLGFGLTHFYSKAPSFKRSKDWIANNVRTPTDYVQIDYEQLRIDAIEWGINTADLENIIRLTPKVFRIDLKSTWCFKHNVDFTANMATIENTQYCLDRAISVILKKQNHKKSKRYPKTENFSNILDFYLGDPVHEKPTHDSLVVHTISEGFSYIFVDVLNGFDNDMYYYIECHPKDDEKGWVPGRLYGYLPIRQKEALPS